METHCRSLFAYDGHDRASHIDERAPRCACESCSFSKFGVLGSQEVVIRLVLSPRHLNKRQTAVRAAVLTHAETIGLSAFRESHVSDDELKATCAELVSKAREADPSAGVFGVLRMPLADLKAGRPEEGGSTPYCAYDLPHRGIEAHVDVFQRVAQARDALIVERRQWLFDRVSPTFVPVDAFRGGLLRPWRPGA